MRLVFGSPELGGNSKIKSFFTHKVDEAAWIWKGKRGWGTTTIFLLPSHERVTLLPHLRAY